MTITSTLLISFQTVEFQDNTSTTIYIITTSNIPVAVLAPKKAGISYFRVFESKDLLSNTQNLFVIKANTTAKIHAIIVERTFDIVMILKHR